jgi:hypothetical protein
MDASRLAELMQRRKRRSTGALDEGFNRAGEVAMFRTMKLFLRRLRGGPHSIGGEAADD